MIHSLANTLILEAYNAQGQLVCRLFYPDCDWSEGESTLIECKSERVHRRIARINGWQFDGKSEMYAWWKNKYASDGTLTESWSRFYDGSSSYTRWQNDTPMICKYPSDQLPKELSDMLNRDVSHETQEHQFSFEL